MSDKLKGILVGTGYWGKKLCEAFRGKAEIVGYYNRGNSELEGIPRIKTHLKYLDALSSDIDFVIVATPLEYLSEYAIDALRFGKHVFLEKPGANALYRLKYLKEVANKAKKKVFVGYKFVYDEMISSLEKDSVHSFELMWHKFGSFNNDIIFNLASHHLSIMKKILGNIDDFEIELYNDNNVWGHNGSNAKFGINRDSKLRYHKIFLNGKDIGYDLNDSICLDNEVDAFLDCIQNNKEPETNIDFAIDIMKVLEKI